MYILRSVNSTQSKFLCSYGSHYVRCVAVHTFFVWSWFGSAVESSPLSSSLCVFCASDHACIVMSGVNESTAGFFSECTSFS